MSWRQWEKVSNRLQRKKKESGEDNKKEAKECGYSEGRTRHILFVQVFETPETSRRVRKK